MKLLVLGGTSFSGRRLVESALARGHDVTLFHRGKTNTGLFAGAEEILGDREGDLAGLGGRWWDAVVDMCGYLPRVVRASAEPLADATSHYTFVSSCSAYRDLPADRVDEDSPVHPLPPEGSERIAEWYGPLKVACERVIDEVFPGRSLVARPGLIVGPYDPTDRFTYWVRRVADGGEVLAPGRAGRPVQVVDARDLGTWYLDMAERGQAGVFNAAGPSEELTMGALLDACVAAADSGATITWVDDAFLLDQGVEPWSDLPMWLPESDLSTRGLFRVDSSRAVATGLRFRPIEDIVADTLSWDRERTADGGSGQLKAGIDRQREGQLLDAWHARSGDPRVDAVPGGKD